MLARTVERDPYLGRLLTGRIQTGTGAAEHADPKALDRDGNVIETARVTKLLAFRGLAREPLEDGAAGDIVTIAGLTEATVADTTRGTRGDTSRCRPSPSTPRRSP